MYEKLRFPRVRQAQLNGEDVRDRWRSVLKDLDDNVEIDPEDVKIKASAIEALSFVSNEKCRTAGFILLTQR